MNGLSQLYAIKPHEASSGHLCLGVGPFRTFRAIEQAGVCKKILERYGKELLRGAIITADPGRIRVRPGVHDT